MTKEDVAALRYTLPEIEQRTKAIYLRCLSESANLCESDFRTIKPEDARVLFGLYDEYFFCNFIRNCCQPAVSFRLSGRMTRTAGKLTHCPGTKQYTISLSSVLLLHAFRDGHTPVVVNGIGCDDRLEATMRVLEHEIVHLLEFVLFGSSSCARPRFGELSGNLFGHTDVTHNLVPHTGPDSERHVVRVGDRACFEYKGSTHCGTICATTKRATVVVNDRNGTYVDSRGSRYSKYYVPFERLR